MKKLILLLATLAPLYSHAMHRPSVSGERVVCHTVQEIADQIVHYENLSAERASELEQVLRQCVEDRLLCYPRPPKYCQRKKDNPLIFETWWNDTRGYELTITTEALKRLIPFITIGGEPFFEQVLAVAIDQGKFKKAKVLVENLLVNVNALDIRGYDIDRVPVPTSMVEKAQWREGENFMPILKLLLRNSANTNIILSGRKVTPLGQQLDNAQSLYANYEPKGQYLEHKNNALAKIELLLQHGASFDEVDTQKRNLVERLEYNYGVMQQQQNYSQVYLQEQRELIDRICALPAVAEKIAERQKRQAADLAFCFEEQQEIEAQNWPQVAGAPQPILTADELLEPDFSYGVKPENPINIIGEFVGE